VNDKMGNPIMISVILVWKVSDTFKACFEVDNYAHFLEIQTDSAVRKLAAIFLMIILKMSRPLLP